MASQIGLFQEIHEDVILKNRSLREENERLRNELSSARNDNELARKSGEVMLPPEYNEDSHRKLQLALEAADRSIEQLQYTKKLLDEDIRTAVRTIAELRGSNAGLQDSNAELQGSNAELQASIAELEATLREVQMAWDNEERSGASGDNEALQEQEEELQENKQSLEEKDQIIRDKDQFIGELQAELNAVRDVAALAMRGSRENTMDEKALPETDKEEPKMVQGLGSSGNAQVGGNAPSKGVYSSGTVGPTQDRRTLQPPASGRKTLVAAKTPVSDEHKSADGFTKARGGKWAQASRGNQQRLDAGLPSSNRFAPLTSHYKPASTLTAQAQTTTKSQKPPRILPSIPASTQAPVRPLRSTPASVPADVKRRPVSEEVASMQPLANELHSGLQNQGSRSGADAAIETGPLTRLKALLNPGATSFNPVGFKSMAQVAVEPRPPVVSRPEDEDNFMNLVRSTNAKALAVERAETQAIAKSKIPDNKKIKDAAAGKIVEPGKPKPKSQTTPQDPASGTSAGDKLTETGQPKTSASQPSQLGRGKATDGKDTPPTGFPSIIPVPRPQKVTSASIFAARPEEDERKTTGVISEEKLADMLRPDNFDWTSEFDDPSQSLTNSGGVSLTIGKNVPGGEYADKETPSSSQADNMPQDKTMGVESPPALQANPVPLDVTDNTSLVAADVAKDPPVTEKVEQTSPTETANPEPESAGVAKSDGAKGSDLPPHEVIVGKKNFIEEDMFKAQQSRPSRSKIGKNKAVFVTEKQILDLEREKAKLKAGSDGAKAAGQRKF